MVKKKNKITKSIITIIIIIALISLAVFGFRQIQQTSFLGDNAELLPYCSTENGCINYLIGQGMPSDYLEVNEITITCENEKCYAQK